MDINSGTVVLNGIDQANTLTVFSGAILAGTGFLDPAMTIAGGGTLSPGTPGGFGTMVIAPSLTFDAGSFYAIRIAPGAGNNNQADVIGTANLNGNGTVVVTPQPGHYDTVYIILATPTPADRVGTFAGLTTTSPFIGTLTLDYTTNPGDVDLDANGAALFGTPGGVGLNQNQQNVLNGINNAIFNSTGNTALPPQFLALGNLTGAAFANALSQLDGEVETGAENSAFQMMDQFLNLMLDPFVDGRSGSGWPGGGGGAVGFAPSDQASFPPDIALAYNSVLNKPPPKQNFDQRWAAWGSAFGGSSITDGNAVVGSTNVTASDFGVAAGMDYHVTPNTVYGFALAGGGTNWGLAQSLGGGRSDAFQAGVYGTSRSGPVYMSGALAFANHWFTTNRIALGDKLTAKFDGQSYAARGEVGYRYAMPVDHTIVGVTPYTALQAQYFHTPSYSETDLSGGGLGLAFNAMHATDTRSELGARFDNLQIVDNMPLVLRGRLAWAHDWVSNPSLGAVFQALPGSNFTVNGAAVPKNSALTTAAAELHLTANWTAIAKFDGEFASAAQTYSGTGTLKYSW